MLKTTYERIKELEKRKNRLDEFYNEVKLYKHLCLSKTPNKNVSFWNQNERSKRVSGMPQIIDLPDDIGLQNMVMKAISEEEERITKELNELLS